MPDVFTPSKRSDVMSRIRGRGNKETELALAKLLRHYRISGWRRNMSLRITGAELQKNYKTQKIIGPTSLTHLRFAVKPDFTFIRKHVTVFVDGCFWHGCPKHSTLPTNNREFWRHKLAANKERDRIVSLTLRRAGWRVVRIWEHDLTKHSKACIKKIHRALEQENQFSLKGV